MATDEAATPPATGHPIGFWFFFWGEFAERCSYYGMRAILAKYMTERLGVAQADAGTYMSLFIAACYFFPLIGGYLADNFFGKYWTIIGFSVPYVVAQFLVGVEDPYLVTGALALLAMGSGVIKPNISTLMGLTYDQQRPGREQLRTSAFSWFYMAINIGAALSQFTMPWLRNHYSYQTAFLFPAGFMALALIVFAAGKRFYAVETVGRAGQSEDEAAAGRALKIETLGRIAPVFLLVMFFWAIFDQAASTWIFFADTYMDKALIGERLDGRPVLLSGDSLHGLIGARSWGMSADAIQGFNPVFIILLVPVSVWIFKSFARSGLPVRATQKLTLGFILTGLTMLIMSGAGFLAGAKQPAVKVTLPEGELILPKSAVELDKVAATDGKAAVGFGDGPVRATAADWAYDTDKNRATLSNGELALGTGTVVTVTNGHVDFFRSPGLVAGDRLVTDGAREATFKPGRYPYGPDALVINKDGKVTIERNAAAAAPTDEKPVKATLEATGWVPPAERVTVWWQVLAYLILTVAEILISVTGLELAFVAAPPTMKSFVTACWLVTVALANFLINAPITRLYSGMQPGHYFAMLAAAMALVVLIFQPVAARYNRGSVVPSVPDEGETEAK